MRCGKKFLHGKSYIARWRKSEKCFSGFRVGFGGKGFGLLPHVLGKRDSSFYGGGRDERQESL